MTALDGRQAGGDDVPRARGSATAVLERLDRPDRGAPGRDRHRPPAGRRRAARRRPEGAGAACTNFRALSCAERGSAPGRPVRQAGCFPAADGTRFEHHDHRGQPSRSEPARQRPRRQRSTVQHALAGRRRERALAGVRRRLRAGGLTLGSARSSAPRLAPSSSRARPRLPARHERRVAVLPAAPHNLLRETASLPACRAPRRRAELHGPLPSGLLPSSAERLSTSGRRAVTFIAARGRRAVGDRCPASARGLTARRRPRPRRPPGAPRSPGCPGPPATGAPTTPVLSPTLRPVTIPIHRWPCLDRRARPGLASSRDGRAARGKVAIVTGAGSRGPGLGNGKAAAILFAREGARVLCVDQALRARRGDGRADPRRGRRGRGPRGRRHARRRLPRHGRGRGRAAGAGSTSSTTTSGSSPARTSSRRPRRSGTGSWRSI